MPDLIVRNVPAETVRRIEATAARLGLSREEYLRRALNTLNGSDPRPLTRDDLSHAAATFADIEDPSVMDKAWS